MSAQARVALRGWNPNVLMCIANLSNDEVFTPPEFANRLLDTLAKAWAADNHGADIWTDKTARFLDPWTKSSVFLREITSRLINGLGEESPNLEERVDHVLTNLMFGIGITQLTNLLARRSLYCSRHARDNTPSPGRLPTMMGTSGSSVSTTVGKATDASTVAQDNPCSTGRMVKNHMPTRLSIPTPS